MDIRNPMNLQGNDLVKWALLLAEKAVTAELVGPLSNAERRTLLARLRLAAAFNVRDEDEGE